jgi:hypothetical protein
MRIHADVCMMFHDCTGIYDDSLADNRHDVDDRTVHYDRARAYSRRRGKYGRRADDRCYLDSLGPEKLRDRPTRVIVADAERNMIVALWRAGQPCAVPQNRQFQASRRIGTKAIIHEACHGPSGLYCHVCNNLPVAPGPENDQLLNRRQCHSP